MIQLAGRQWKVNFPNPRVGPVLFNYRGYEISNPYQRSSLTNVKGIKQIFHHAFALLLSFRRLPLTDGQPSHPLHASPKRSLLIPCMTHVLIPGI